MQHTTSQNYNDLKNAPLAEDIEEYKLSEKPQKAMQEMMDTIDELRGVYVKETEALTEANTQGFFAVQDEKLYAARKYQARVSEILKRRDEMKIVDPETRAKLERMQSEFSTLAGENLKALERMNRCMENLSSTLQNAVTEAARKKRTFAYKL